MDVNLRSLLAHHALSVSFGTTIKWGNSADGCFILCKARGTQALPLAAWRPQSSQGSQETPAGPPFSHAQMGSRNAPFVDFFLFETLSLVCKTELSIANGCRDCHRILVSRE